MLTENTARLTRSDTALKKWDEYIDKRPPDNRTGEEIARDVIARAGLRWADEPIRDSGEVDA